MQRSRRVFRWLSSTAVSAMCFCSFTIHRGGGTAGFAPTVYFPFPTLYSLTHMHYANFFELSDDAAILMSNSINHMMFFELHRVSMWYWLNLLYWNLCFWDGLFAATLKARLGGKIGRRTFFRNTLLYFTFIFCLIFLLLLVNIDFVTNNNNYYLKSLNAVSLGMYQGKLYYSGQKWRFWGWASWVHFFTRWLWPNQCYNFKK